MARLRLKPIVKTGGTAVGILLGILVLAASPPEGLSEPGVRCLGIAIICFTLWLFNPIPLAATSLLAVVLLPMFGVLGSAKAFSFFGNNAVFFLLGVFILSGAVTRTGLSKRITLAFLRRFDKTPDRLIFGVIFTTSFLSLWMPEHAVAAMMFPVVLGVAIHLKLPTGNSNFGKALFLALAWGAGAGGVGTYLGGARTPLAVELMKESFGRDITFVSWAASGIPVSIVVTAIGYLLLLRFFKSEVRDVTGVKKYLEGELQVIGPLSSAEWRTAVLVLVTIGFWVAAGHRFGLAEISICAGILVFVLRIATWQEIVDYVNWGVVIMYGGAVALGKALADTQAIDWIASTVLGAHSLSPFAFVVALSGLSLLLTEMISNAAAVVIILPLAFGFVHSMGLAPELIVRVVAIPAGLAFMLPVGTPPNAIAYSAGYFSVRDSAQAGLVFKIISWVVFLLLARYYWPVIGLHF